MTAIRVMLGKGVDGKWLADVFGVTNTLITHIRLGKTWARQAPITRDEGRIAGAKYYKSRVACDRGHAGLRLVETDECCECIEEKRQELEWLKKQKKDQYLSQLRECPICDKKFHKEQGVVWHAEESIFCSIHCKRRADALEGVKMQWDHSAFIPGEEWHPVKGLEDCYEVSDHGRIRSLDRHMPLRDGALRFYRGKIMTPRFGSGGYALVSLYGRDGIRHVRVHVLVLETFVGPRPSRQHDGCHEDGNPANNALSNLRWDTIDENLRDVVRHGRAWWQQRTKKLAAIQRQD